MKVKLVEHGASAGHLREITITQSEFLVGRAADSDLRLHESSISRHHCIIRTSGEEVSLVDLGSSNGTYCNNHRVRSQVTLHGGDEIRLGTCRFLVDLGDQTLVDLGAVVKDDSHEATVKLRDQSPQ